MAKCSLNLAAALPEDAAHPESPCNQYQYRVGRQIQEADGPFGPFSAKSRQKLNWLPGKQIPNDRGGRSRDRTIHNAKRGGRQQPFENPKQVI
jgi:hypothetical protein